LGEIIVILLLSLLLIATTAFADEGNTTTASLFEDVDSSFIATNKSSELDKIRKQMLFIEKWSGKVIEMDSKFQKLYNTRVAEVKTSLSKVYLVISKSKIKELSFYLNLPKYSRAFVENYQVKSFKIKKIPKVFLNDYQKISFKSFNEINRKESVIINQYELSAFASDINRKKEEKAAFFIISEILDLLDAAGYPDLNKEFFKPEKRYYELVNQFLRRDLHFFKTKDVISELLLEYSKNSIQKINYYATYIQKNDPKALKIVDYKRIAFDMQDLYTVASRGKLTDTEQLEANFYLDYINEIFISEGIATEIPKVNLKLVRDGLATKIVPYNRDVLLEKILEVLRRRK
jgi:hypothetical protein